MERVTIGECELYCGDCREVLPLIGRVDAVVMDPPYGVGLTEKRPKHGGIHKASSKYPDTPEHVLPAILNAVEWSKKNARNAVVTSGIRLMHDYPKPASIGCIFSPNGAGCDTWGFGCFQPILYYGRCPYLATSQGSRPNSFSSSHPGMHVSGEDKIDHPCPKPIEWMTWLVNRGSLKGETILDPFMGSGTTGVACVRTGRKFIGIEINPDYFTIACERIAAANGKGSLFESVEQPALFATEKP